MTENRQAQNVNNQSQPAAAAVAVKLPEFWKSDPAMWFAQAEAQFALAGITQDTTMFHHIVAKIDQSVICHIADLVKNPPATDKYDAVKLRLISRFELTPQSRLERLLSSCDLGDLRPTHLLAKMQELSAGLNVDESLLKMLFLQRLPVNIRAVLSIHDGTLAKIAEMGDKMIDLSPPTSAAVDVRASVAPSSNQDPYSQESLANQIAALTAEIRRMRSKPQRSRTRSTSRSRQAAGSNNVCWYHRKFGNDAEQCRGPCSYQASKN